MQRLLPGLLTCVVLLLVPTASADEMDRAHDALEARTAEALEALAKRCTKKRLFGKRDEVYEVLLQYDPLHAKARKRLKYERGEDGLWHRTKRYKRPTNWKPQLLDEMQAELEAILNAHRQAVLDLCDEAKTLPTLLQATRRVERIQSRFPEDARAPRLLRRLLLRTYRLVREKGLVGEMADTAKSLRALHPQDVEVRSALGETQHAGAWVLEETARTLSRENGIHKAVAEALPAAALGEGSLSNTEAKIELPWKAVVAGEDVRAVGTAQDETLGRIARVCQAAGPVFEVSLGKAPKRRAALTFYVFGAEGEIETFLAGYPVVANPSLSQRKEHGLDLVFADSHSMVLKKNPPDAQLDLSVNTVLNQMFSDTFLENEDCKGWHAEGISRYLAYRLTGTRLSINVAGRYAGQGGDRHVPESKDPWLKKVQGYLKTNPDVGLQLMLGKGLDVFSARDAVLSYGFAVYLLEGFDALTADFVRVITRTSDVDRACREILGMPRSVVEARFKVWLDEVTSAEPPARKPPSQPQ